MSQLSSKAKKGTGTLLKRARPHIIRHWEVWLVPSCRKPAWLRCLHYITVGTVSSQWAIKILLEKGARECIQKHSQMTWISISFMTFGSCITKRGLYKRQEAALSKASGQGCGADTRDSSGQYDQDWGGDSNPSLTSLKSDIMSDHPSCPVAIPLSKNKYRCICAMCSSSPQLWLPWTVPVPPRRQHPSPTSLQALQETVYSSNHPQWYGQPLRDNVPTSSLANFHEWGKRCAGDNTTSNY